MKRLLALSVLVVAFVGLMVTPALAEGYNQSGGAWNAVGSGNWTSGGTYANQAGFYVRSPQAGATNQVATSKGPHGDYNTTTNKCQDCHSTHYATGSYMLLRSDSRQDACTFCHGGGGGSRINIQMDNAYNATGVDESNTTGFGTGHTLGFANEAPADIRPAYKETNGFACFNCHSPHGNSARIIATLGDPGAAMDQIDMLDGTKSPGIVKGLFTTAGGAFTSTSIHGVTINASALAITSANITSYGLAGYYPAAVVDAGYYDLGKMWDKAYGAGTSLATTGTLATQAPGMIWSKSDVAGNMVFRNWSYGGKPGNLTPRPIFAAGKYLLLKNPNNELNSTGSTITVYSWERTSGGTGTVAPQRGKVLNIGNGQPIPDTVVPFKFIATTGNDVADGVVAAANWGATVPAFRQPGKQWIAGDYTLAQIEAGSVLAGDWRDTADYGVNKYAVDWKAPLGPADNAYGPEQDVERWYRSGTLGASGGWPGFLPSTTNGFTSVSEFCADCHDGTVGASTQKANVWLDADGPSGGGAGGYILAYSHDAQPRH